MDESVYSDSQCQMIDLLKSWNFSDMASTCIIKRNQQSIFRHHVFERSKHMSLDIHTFKILTETDLACMFPVPPLSNLGYKVQFRENLKNWRRSQNIEPELHSLDDLRDWMTKFADDFQNSRLSSTSSSSSTLFVTNEFSPSCSSSPVPPNFPEPVKQSFDLNSYILQSNTGKLMWNAYINNNNCLPMLMRNKLISDIVQHFVDSKQFMHRSNFEKISDDICTTFQNERKETYFSVNGTHNAGRLFNAYKNTASRLRKVNLFPREKNSRTKRKHANFEDSPQSQSSVPLNTDDPTQVWLQVYSEEWEEIIPRWKATCQLRQEQIEQAGRNIGTILIAWPRYTHSKGFQLVDIDFDFLHPNKGHLLLSKWDDFKAKIIPVFQNRIKQDKQNLEILNNLLEQYRNHPKNPNQDITIWKFLHSLLAPTGFTKNKNTKKVWKFSILDGQNAFIKEIKSFNSIHEELAGINKTYLENNITLQPIIFAVNDNESNLLYYAVYDNIFYKYNNLISALTTAFKLHYVFGLKYQIQCKLVWEFIQEYFFEINAQSNSTTMSTLLSSLYNRQQI